MNWRRIHQDRLTRSSATTLLCTKRVNDFQIWPWYSWPYGLSFRKHVVCYVLSIVSGYSSEKVRCYYAKQCIFFCLRTSERMIAFLRQTGICLGVPLPTPRFSSLPLLLSLFDLCQNLPVFDREATGEVKRRHFAAYVTIRQMNDIKFQWCNEVRFDHLSTCKLRIQAICRWARLPLYTKSYRGSE